MSKFVVNVTGIQTKYGSSSASVISAIGELGESIDVSGLTSDEVQSKIAGLQASEAACLVGGYDLIPAFSRNNPTLKPPIDDDLSVPTDAPYGATPGAVAEEFAPRRAISRLPDSLTADASGFVALLKLQNKIAKQTVSPGTFEIAAAEFGGAQGYVHDLIPGVTGTPRLSPPYDDNTAGLIGEISGRGRIHVLLHGANFDPSWSTLFGKAATSPQYITALSAPMLQSCALRHSFVTFSSCYAAMLDVEPATTGARNTVNQVALACLAAGAKAVFGATRSNWINIRAPFSGYGPSLMAEVWTELGKGTAAAEALRIAKRNYLRGALIGDPADQPYAQKTVLQTQCYGHPDAIM